MFWLRFSVETLRFWFFCECMDFCHRTVSDLVLFFSQHKMLTIIGGRTHYQIPLQVTKDTKLRCRQYRSNYRILATNSYLFKIKCVDSDACSFCSIVTETLWGEFVTLVKNTSSENFELVAKKSYKTCYYFWKKNLIFYYQRMIKHYSWGCGRGGG